MGLDANYSERKSPDNLETRFARRERLETAGGIAEVIDLPTTARTNADPILFAPAWACTLRMYKPALRTINEAGRRVVSLDHPRRGGEVALTDAEKGLTKDFPVEETRKALTLRDVIRTKNLDRLDIIAHSEGAINASIAALLLAEEAKNAGRESPVKNILLFGPAGLIGEDSPARLLRGFAAQGDAKPTLEKFLETEEDREKRLQAAARGHITTKPEYAKIEPNPEAQEAIVGTGRVPTVFKELGKYVAANPARALREGWGMSTAQIDDLIARLREHGISIVIMSGVDDPVFSTKTMAERLAKNSVDGFLSVRGGHGGIGENPELFATAAVQMLDAAENKRLKKLQLL